MHPEYNRSGCILFFSLDSRFHPFNGGRDSPFAPRLRLIKDPSLRNSFFKAFYPVNWTYGRFKRDGNASITSAKVLECHQCHSIAFHLTGDLIFTQFP